jgi:hypothetical protein
MRGPAWRLGGLAINAASQPIGNLAQGAKAIALGRTTQPSATAIAAPYLTYT